MVRKEQGIDQLALELIELATKMQESSVARVSVPLYGRDGETVALVSVARTLMAQRRARTQFMPPSLFHEPAWDILLSLFIAQEEGRTLNVKHLVQLIDTAVTTSQRWIDQLTHMHLIDRIIDPDDRRKLEVALSDRGRAMLVPYLQSLVTA